MHPAVGAVSNQRERGALVHKAWNRFNVLNLLSHAIVATTWFVGRGMLSSRKAKRRARAASIAKGLVGLAIASPWSLRRSSGAYIDKQTETLVTAKDALIVTSLVSGVTSIVAGQFIREAGTKVAAPLDERGMVSQTADRKARVGEAITTTAGAINVFALAGIVALTAILSMKAGSSPRWSLISRQLP